MKENFIKGIKNVALGVCKIIVVGTIITVSTTLIEEIINIKFDD